MANKKLDRIKTAGAEMDKFFSGSIDADHGTPEAAVQTAPGGTNKKKVFSFRAGAEKVDSWRVWADASGMKVDELGEKALTEYIKKHPLTEDQRKIYELKLAQKNS